MILTDPEGQSWMEKANVCRSLGGLESCLLLTLTLAPASSEHQDPAYMYLLSSCFRMDGIIIHSSAVLHS